VLTAKIIKINYGGDFTGYISIFYFHVKGIDCVTQKILNGKGHL